MWRLAKSSVRVSKRHLSGSPLTQWDHDVLICGGGVVGAALAADILMRTNGACSVGLVEMSPPKPSVRTMAESPDVRVYALSPNSIQQLTRLGAWKYIDERSKPYNTMQVWEESGPGLLRFSSTDMGAPELGRICEDQTIQSAIYQAIKDNGHTMTTYYGCSVDDLKLPVSAVNPMGGAVASIQPKDAKQERKQVSARLIVGADGANSAVRRLSGISTWGWGYGAEAVVATVRLPGYGQPTASAEQAGAGATDAAAGTAQSSQQSRPLSNDTAWQKYLPTGPLALLPLWDGYASIVWSTSIADAKRLKALPEDQFLVELNAALQTPPATDKWSVFEKSDASASNFPPFLSNLFAATGGAASPLKGVLGGNPFQLLQRVKKEVASVADVLMSAAQLGDPLQYPPALVALCGPRVSFPLSFSQASAYTAPRCALVGDAAHSIHPQAGQGLNLGIQDAITLSDNIVRTLKTGGDIGNASMLKDYERERYVKNLGMMSLVDTINTVFKDSRGAYPASSNVRQPHTQSATGAAQNAETNTQEQASTSSRGAENVDFGQSVRKNVVGALNFMPKTKQFLRSAGMLGIHQLGPMKNKIAKFAMGLDSNNAVPK